MKTQTVKIISAKKTTNISKRIHVTKEFGTTTLCGRRLGEGDLFEQVEDAVDCHRCQTRKNAIADAIILATLEETEDSAAHSLPDTDLEISSQEI